MEKIVYYFFIFSLPIFDEFEVGTGGLNSYQTSPPSYPHKNPFTTKDKSPSSVSDEVGYSDPQSKPNEEEKQMYPSLKPPKIKVQPKPEKHSNTGIALNTTNYDEDLRKPPFRFPLKEYTQEILQQNVQNNRTKVPQFQEPIMNNLNKFVSKTTATIPQTTQAYDGFDSALTILQAFTI